MYHDVVPRSCREESGFPGPVAARYKLDPDDFVAHLDAVAATGAIVGLIGSEGPWPDVAITFDDGGASALDAASLLEVRGWRGHFFVTSGFVGRPGFLDDAGVRALAARGHVVGSHSSTHPRYMGRLSPTELDAEWTTSRDLLAGILGEPPVMASIPGGYFAREVVASASRAGYELLFTSEPSSRRRWVGGTEYVGRYTIWDTTPAETAAGYAAGARLPRARLWVEWNAKKAAKRASPAVYRLLQSVRAKR